MIDDLDKTLKRLLSQKMSSLDRDEAKIRFEAPDSEFSPPSLPAVNLFLYDIRENLELRSNEWVLQRNNDGTAVRKRPPTRVECSYLVTAWAGDVKSEHKLLGEAMTILLRYPTIPEKMLKDTTLEGQEPPLPAITLQPGRLQSLGEFWQALGGKPKAALNYSVTIGVEPYEEIPEKVVLEQMIKFKQFKPDVKR